MLPISYARLGIASEGHSCLCPGRCSWKGRLLRLIRQGERELEMFAARLHLLSLSAFEPARRSTTLGDVAQ